MITKPEQHDTNRAGKRMLREAVEGLGWVANEIFEDYGIDYNIQIFDQAKKAPTGASFHVQLKSSQSSEYSAKQDFVSQELSIDHARHYALEMRDPLIVIHADVGRNKLYWYAPQRDTGLIERITDTEQDSVIVRVPTGQEFPVRAAELLTALNEIYLLLGSRELASAPNAGFAEALKHFPGHEDLGRALQDKNDAVKVQRVVELFRAGKYEEARPRANALLADPDSSVETKFWAEIELEALDYREILHSGKPQAELPKTILKHARSLRNLTKSGPAHLKFHALIAVKAAELEVLAHDNSGLFMALQQHLQTGGAPMMVLDVYARRSANTKRLIAKYNQCVRLARYAANYRERWALPRALTRIVNAVGRYASTLRFERNLEAENMLTSSALQICKLAAWIARETGDSDALILSIMSSLMTVHSEDSDAYRWAITTTNEISDAGVREDALSRLDRATRRWRGESVEGDYQGNAYVQIAQNIASSLGLDPTNETDPLMQVLMIAAKDSSPERVLSQCEHLLVSQGAIGPLARRVRLLFSLGTGGSKVVHCTLHNYHNEGRELDAAFEPFSKRYCDVCPDKNPRPQGWRYTEAVRKDLERRNHDFVARLAGTERGFRFTNHD